MEALIFSCIALFLHYNRKLVLFSFCLFILFMCSKLLIILYPYYIFQNIIIISIMQLIFICCIYKIDSSQIETSTILFVFASFTIVIIIGYFYLPFINSMSWILYFESRISLEFVVWINFTIFKDTCKVLYKQNILFIVWIILGYNGGLWLYLI